MSMFYGEYHRQGGRHLGIFLMKSTILRVSSFSKTALNLRAKRKKKRLQVANLFRTSPAGHSPWKSTNAALPSGAYNRYNYGRLEGNPSMDSQEHLCINAGVFLRTNHPAVSVFDPFCRFSVCQEIKIKMNLCL